MSIPPEVDFGSSVSIKPTYNLLRINQQSGGTEVTLTHTGSSNSTFELPANVMNFDKSFLQFLLTVPAQGGTEFGNILTSGTLSPIRDINLFTPNGMRIATLPDVGRFLKVVSMTDTKLQDFLTMDKDTGFSASDATGAARGNYALSVADGADTKLADARTINHKSYVEPAGVRSSSAVNTELQLRYRIPMSAFKHTIFEDKRDVFFDSIVSLSIDWRPMDQSVVQSSAISLATQAVTTNIPTLTELNYYIAIQATESLAKQVRDKVRSSGMSFLVDYVYSYNSVQTGESHALTQRLSSAHGKRLKRIYSVPYVGLNPTLSNYFNHATDQKDEALLTVYTQLQGRRIQQWNMDSVDNDEYMVMSDRLKGSVIQSRPQFNLNYFFIDSWDGMKFHERKPNEECGLKLDREIKYDLLATTEGKRLWYQYAVVQRRLNISSAGITWG